MKGSYMMYLHNDKELYKKIPKALFNSKALFNPYQYLPFNKMMSWDNENERYIENGKNVLVTDEVGVGKTFEIGIILRELLHLNPELTALILCPVKLCENWKKELYDNFYIGAINYYKEKTFGQITIVPYSYFSSASSKSLSEDIKNEYELRNGGCEREQETLYLTEELSSILPYDILILDEAHYIRNKGKLWRYVDRLIEESEENESKTKIFMTGTPVFNNEEDYNNITELLTKDLPKGNIQEFGITKTLQSEANCYDKLLEIEVWNYPKATTGSGLENKQSGVTPNNIEKDIIDELYATKDEDDGNTREKSKYGRLTGFLKRIASSSIYSLKKFIENRYEFSTEILEYHESTEKDFDTEDFEADDLKDILKDWQPNDDTKLQALRELIKSEFDNNSNENKKAIIFSCFITTCEYLEEHLGTDYHVYLITGRTSAEQVENMKAMFEKDEKPSILICSDAAKEGHNLQFCQLLIHYDLPYTPAAIGQRNGRIYRRGQEGIPKAFYMLFNQGYDLRLFGEIILGKCQVIKNMEEEGKLSWINILPNDARDYVNACIEQYIEERLNESNKEKIIAAKELLEKKFSEIRINDEGKKIRDENGNVSKDWNYKRAEELYNQINENFTGNITEALTNLFTDGNEINGNTLQDYYKQKYDDELKKFCEDYLEADFRESSESAKYIFKECCREILGGKYTKFCHDMIDSDITIGEYKEQFEPLKEWEQNENGK
ncbi:DEAD/DEAH box helicase [Lachnoanaerobaculum umeaense]|uniref:DEAD/DEAH box helicase n=2 Tax=Lachnoanaerobaculum umeaense TaxID=617123 RepID=A0A385Q191_9FIRM|nr:DEAD/DEAH box helicase [Lachnoanaerobaculum umeaense]